MTTGQTAPTETSHAAVHWLSLFAALTIMLAGTIYPLVFARADGTADHSLAMALFWAMSAGLVRGVSEQRVGILLDRLQLCPADNG